MNMWMNYPRLLFFRSPWLLSLLVPKAITHSHTFLHNFKEVIPSWVFWQYQTINRAEILTLVLWQTSVASLRWRQWRTPSPRHVLWLAICTSQKIQAILSISNQTVSVKHYPWPSHSTRLQTWLLYKHILTRDSFNLSFREKTITC